MVPDIHAKFHNQPFIMRRAIWRHVFGHTDPHTHAQLNHQRLVSDKSAIPVQIFIQGSPLSKTQILHRRIQHMINVNKNHIYPDINLRRSRDGTVFVPSGVFCLLRSLHSVRFGHLLRCAHKCTSWKGRTGNFN